MIESTYRLPVMETVKAAWAKVSGAKGSFWAVVGLFFLIQIVIGILLGLTANYMAVNFILNVLTTLVQIAAGAGVVYLGIRRAQDIPIQYKMVKEVITARIILYIIVLYILQMLIFIPAGLIALLGLYLGDMQVMPVKMISLVFYIAATILFIFLSIRMWVAYGAVVDKNLNPWEALKLSFKATESNVWNLIGIYLLCFLIFIVCTVTFGIGFIWGVPWLLIIYGESYKRLVTRQDIRG